MWDLEPVCRIKSNRERLEGELRWLGISMVAVSVVGIGVVRVRTPYVSLIFEPPYFTFFSHSRVLSTFFWLGKEIV
jgi:hypothetical protein